MDSLCLVRHLQAEETLMPFDPQTPYNDLPPLPPPVELETRVVLKKAIAANLLKLLVS
jgi:hypothetical protein